MSSILVGVKDGKFEFSQRGNTALIEFVIKDAPSNVDTHMRLIGLLVGSNLVVSDDNGNFTVSVEPKKEDE